MLRWLGRILFLIGIIILVFDIANVAGQSLDEAIDFKRSSEGLFASLGEWMAWAMPDLLQQLQPAIERHISPDLFDPYVLTLLVWPAALQFIALALILWGLNRLIFRRRGEYDW